nr:hypothetical protein OG781_02155 [Streptomyces sp. NBC_00830]
MAIELSDELIELERAAWAEQQENRLTVETAARVQTASPLTLKRQNKTATTSNGN